MTRFWCGLAMAAAAFSQEQSPDQQLTQLLFKGDRTKVMGDAPAAVSDYEEALRRVRTETTLAIREQEVLQRLAAGYIAANRPVDAVRVSRQILALRQDDCKPGGPGVERCADAQYGLGLSLMHAGEFLGAVTYLSDSAANLAAISTQGDEFNRASKTKERGDVQALLAAALFRTGQKEKAIAMFHTAITTLKSVAENQKIDPGTRGSARNSQTDAEGSLKLLEAK